MTEEHLDNAVAYFEHLTSQEVGPATALNHTQQRFGISREALLERVNGRVANHVATMEALALVKYALTGENMENFSQGEVQSMLRDLYNAITGEEL